MTTGGDGGPAAQSKEDRGGTRDFSPNLWIIWSVPRERLTPGRNGGMFLRFGRLSSGWRDVVVDSFVVIVDRHRQHLLSMGLANNILIQIGIDLR